MKKNYIAPLAEIIMGDTMSQIMAVSTTGEGFNVWDLEMGGSTETADSRSLWDNYEEDE